jgi:O-antigen ligase
MREINDVQESKPVWLYLERIIFYGLLAVVALSAVPYGTVEPWWIALFECLVFAGGALWFITGLFKGDWRLPLKRLLWPLVALVVFILVQTINFGGPRTTAEVQGTLAGTISADPYESRLTILKLLALILTFVILHSYTKSHRRLRALIYVVIGIGVASALFGILRQTTHHSGVGYLLPGLKPNSGYGQFINRNHFAFLMEMSLGLALGLLAGGGVNRERALIYVSLSLPLWFSLVLSNSRGGIFSMLCQLVFAALMFMLVRVPQLKSSSRGTASGLLSRAGNSIVIRALLIVCLLIGVGLSVIWIGGEQLANRLEAQGDGDAERIALRYGESRSEVWRATWALIKDNPVAGVGFGGYWAVIPKYHDASGELTPQQAHNDYLEILASGGIIGLALCAWFVFALVSASRRQLRSVDGFRRAACMGALVGLFGVGVHSLFDFGLHTTSNAFVFVVLAVLATAELSASAHDNRGKESTGRRLPVGEKDEKSALARRR